MLPTVISPKTLVNDRKGIGREVRLGNEINFLCAEHMFIILENCNYWTVYSVFSKVQISSCVCVIISIFLYTSGMSVCGLETINCRKTFSDYVYIYICVCDDGSGSQLSRINTVFIKYCYCVVNGVKVISLISK